MSTNRKRAVLSSKDKQIIISRLDKGEKGTILAQKFGISKQQISDPVQLISAAKTNDGLRIAIKLQVFEANKHA